ncbi:hypothetical protein [Thermodesulfatator indicus]
MARLIYRDLPKYAELMRNILRRIEDKLDEEA